MTTAVSTAYQVEHNKLERTPAYLLNFAGIDQVYGTHRTTGTVSDLSDDADLDFALDLDKTYDLDAGLEVFLRDLFGSDAFALTLPYMQLPQGIAAQIEPDRGRSTIGSIVVLMTDVNGGITELIGFGIGGRLATFRAGFANIPEEEFATFFTGIVSGYKMTSDLTGYEVTVRDPQTLANKQVFECAASKLTALLTESPTDTYTHYLQLPQGKFIVTNNLDAAAFGTALDSAYGAGNWSYYQAAVASIGSTITVADTQFFKSAGYVLIDAEIIAYSGKTSTTFTGLTRGALGSTPTSHTIGASAKELLRIGPAHPCDLIQGILTNTDKTGVGIDPALIDSATFDAVKASMGAYQMEFRITSRINAKQFLEDELYQIIACYPIITGTGLLSIREFAEPDPADIVETITDDAIVADSSGKPVLGWDGNFPKIINHVTYYYDYNPITGEFDSHFEDSEHASVSTFKDQPLVLYSKGLRSDLSGTAVFILDRIALILQRYAPTAPVITVRTFLQKNLIEPGEVIGLTSAMVPNRFTNARGVTNELFEVISRTIVFDQGYVDFQLLWTSFGLLLEFEAASDDFERPGSNTLGGNWVETQYPAANFPAQPDVIFISSGSLILGATPSSVAPSRGLLYDSVAVPSQTPQPAQFAQMTFFGYGGGLVRSGPMVLITVSGGKWNGYAVVYSINGFSKALELRKYVDFDPSTGAGTEVLGSFTVTLDQFDAIRITWNNGHLSVYLNNVLVIGPVTDMSITTGMVGAILDFGDTGGDRQVWANWIAGSA